MHEIAPRVLNRPLRPARSIQAWRVSWHMEDGNRGWLIPRANADFGRTQTPSVPDNGLLTTDLVTRTSFMHWLLIGYMFLFIHRPFEFWPTLGDLHVERIYIAVVFLIWLLQPKRWLPNPQHFAYAGVRVRGRAVLGDVAVHGGGLAGRRGLVQDPRLLSSVRHGDQRREETPADGSRLRVRHGRLHDAFVQGVFIRRATRTAWASPA